MKQIENYPVKQISKGSKVHVFKGGLFPGYIGTVERIDKEWNHYYVTVSFPGIDNPVRLNSERLRAV